MEEVEEVKHDFLFLDRIVEYHLHVESLFHRIWEDHSCRTLTSTKQEKIQVKLIESLIKHPNELLRLGSNTILYNLEEGCRNLVAEYLKVGK